MSPITTAIKQRVKTLNFERYKYVVVVMIGEKKEQGVQVREE